MINKGNKKEELSAHPNLKKSNLPHLKNIFTQYEAHREEQCKVAPSVLFFLIYFLMEIDMPPYCR